MHWHAIPITMFLMFRRFVSLSVVLFTLNLIAQDSPKTAPPSPSQVPVITSDLGGECSAEIQVTNVKSKPIYNAKVSLEIKYGFGGFHRTTLDIYTNNDGKVRFEGLPRKSRGPYAFTASYKDRSNTVVVEPRDNCHGSYTVVLPNEPLPTDKDDAQ
jgi:hypothetical protein